MTPNFTLFPHSPVSKKALAVNGIALLIVAGVVALCLYFGGCRTLAGKSAPANETITEVIADAGTAAFTAEQLYQSGQIPQTSTNRTVINDLGNAYNAAKTAWQNVLIAQTAYYTAVNQQLAFCTPPVANPQACTKFTADAKTAQVASTTAASSLNQQISVLVTKTTTVKALAPSK